MGNAASSSERTPLLPPAPLGAQPPLPTPPPTPSPPPRPLPLVLYGAPTFRDYIVTERESHPSFVANLQTEMMRNLKNSLARMENKLVPRLSCELELENKSNDATNNFNAYVLSAIQSGLGQFVVTHYPCKFKLLIGSLVLVFVLLIMTRIWIAFERLNNLKCACLMESNKRKSLTEEMNVVIGEYNTLFAAYNRDIGCHSSIDEPMFTELSALNDRFEVLRQYVASGGTPRRLVRESVVQLFLLGASFFIMNVILPIVVYHHSCKLNELKKGADED